MNITRMINKLHGVTASLLSGRDPSCEVGVVPRGRPGGLGRLPRATRIAMNFPAPDSDPVRLCTATAGGYALRLVQGEAELQAAQRLRFEVFNLELGEGLEESHATGLDSDPFDAVCDHLLVEHVATRTVVGTYRLQTGRNAAGQLGYYSEQEFDFGPFEPHRGEMIELGRACVDRNHRNLVVLGVLWPGIGAYAKSHGGRYLMGCSSLTSQDPALGAAAYLDLKRRHLAPAGWQTVPQPAFACPLDNPACQAPPIPKLLRAYLAVGAGICGPPALDRQFKTIDFLTWLDLEALPPATRARFLG